MKEAFIAILIILLCGCATGEKIRSGIEIGMTKQQVIDVLGKPDGASESGDLYALTYTDRLISGWGMNRTDYTIILKNDRVVQYGAGQVRQNQSGALVIIPVK